MLSSKKEGDLFSNRNFVDKVRKVNSGITFNANGGEIGTTEAAEFAPLEDEEIWFNNRGIANVLSMAKIVDRRNEINRRMCSNLHPKRWLPHKTNRMLAGELHDNEWNYYACYRSVRLKKEEHKRWDFKTLELNSLVGTCTRCHETGFVGIQPM